MNTYTVYYRKHNNSRLSYLVADYGLPNKITEINLAYDFVPVMVVDAEDKEEVFWQMQGEVWSPNGEAREAIKQLGLSHTSMSVADVIYDHKEDKYYFVDTFGFKEVPLTKR